MATAAKGGVNKMDAVREILKKHGKDTMPTDIVELAKKEHGVEITTGTASNYKGTILKEQSEAPKSAAPASKPKAATSGKVNKMEAVREVIKKHGKDITTPDIVKYAKQEHGADMSVEMASTYKSSALKQLGLGGVRKAKKGQKPGPKPAAATANGVKAAPKASTGGNISIDDIEAVKKLVDRMGADKVRQLAGVFAK